MEPPARVKLLGLIPVRKRTYLIVQGIGFVLLAAAVIVTFLVPTNDLLDFLGLKNRPPLLLRVMGLLPWIFLLTLLGEALETYLGLRRFTRQEALHTATFFKD